MSSIPGYHSSPRNWIFKEIELKTPRALSSNPHLEYISTKDDLTTLSSRNGDNIKWARTCLPFLIAPKAVHAFTRLASTKWSGPNSSFLSMEGNMERVRWGRLAWLWPLWAMRMEAHETWSLWGILSNKWRASWMRPHLLYPSIRVLGKGPQCSRPALII